jgi:hypothetical protein
MLASEYESDLKEWAVGELPQCDSWRLETFWPQVMGRGHAITSDTRRFVEQWLALASGAGTGIAKSESGRKLVESRERRLKQARSRFENRAALSQWGGRAGLEPLSYRWPTAHAFLQDWHAGWRRL